ncbi:MAG: amidohydrolase family protein [Candidatus Thermoplasmatota archaeon]|nr:amidohydrolase family protein [Candidatus Thermoplasmatota archaeon]
MIKTDYMFKGDIEEGITQDKFILVENGTIREIIDNSGVIPEADEIIDARGLKVFPGFIDLHVHLSATAGSNLAQSIVEKNEYSALRALHYAKKSLNAGFTTLRDLGSNGYQIIALKEAIRDKWVKGPRILAAGRPLTETGGHGDSPFSNGRVIDGPVEATKAVREQIKAGADVIKIHVSGGGTSPHDNPLEPQLNKDEIDAIVKEAHSKFRKVAAHAQSNAGIRNAAASRVDTIEHALFLDDITCNVIRNNNLIIVPTMVSPIMTSLKGKDAGVPEWAIRKASEAVEPHSKSVKMAKKNGLKIGFGTDAGTPFNFHGNNGKEFEILVGSGDLTPLEAIYAATGIASEALGPSYKVGKILPGFNADMVFVEGDPIDDIVVLTKPSNIKRVLLGGIDVDIK